MLKYTNYETRKAKETKMYTIFTAHFETFFNSYANCFSCFQHLKMHKFSSYFFCILLQFPSISANGVVAWNSIKNQIRDFVYWTDPVRLHFENEIEKWIFFCFLFFISRMINMSAFTKLVLHNQKFDSFILCEFFSAKSELKCIKATALITSNKVRMDIDAAFIAK